MKKKPKLPARKRSASPATKDSAGNKLRTVFTERQIQKRVHELAERINRDYTGKTLHVVGILENCFLFMADLVRALKLPVVCHFVRAQIRDSSAGGHDLREILYTPPLDAAGKDILLVDGILQSGVTLDHLYRYILGQNPTSVRTVTLIEKTDERKVDVATDYVGFKVTGGFLVGYGLGYRDRYRNLSRVATMA